MILTAENYFSKEADREYLSVSQYKNFMGTIGRPACEAEAMAKLSGEWEMKKTTALMVGSYVDAHFEGTLNLFQAQNPEIFTKQGALKSEYRKAEEIINRIERDELFMKYMSGEKQVIMTADMFGSPGGSLSGSSLSKHWRASSVFHCGRFKRRGNRYRTDLDSRRPFTGKAD